MLWRDDNVIDADKLCHGTIIRVVRAIALTGDLELECVDALG